ncbi:hypothetical protein GF415_03205 [Candidatus Micrarchaeota archaeon]|nr:hypothetical protein [Candidatus Micrarchaeota archaeon]
MVHKQGGNGGNRNGNTPRGKGPYGEKGPFRKKHLTSIPGGKQASPGKIEFRKHLQGKLEGLKREANTFQREAEQGTAMLLSMEPQIQELNETLQNQIAYSEDLQSRLESPLSTENREELEREMDSCYHHLSKTLETLEQKTSEYNVVAARIDLAENRLQVNSSRIVLLEQHLEFAGGPVFPYEKTEAEPEDASGPEKHNQPSFGVSQEERYYAEQAAARRADLENEARLEEGMPKKKKPGKSADFIPSISALRAIKSASPQFSKFMEKPVRYALGLVFKGPGRIIKLGLLGVAGIAGVSGWGAGNNALKNPGSATWSSFGKNLWDNSVENLKAVRDLSFDGANFIYNHAFEVSCGLGAFWTATGVFQPTPSKKLKRMSLGTAIMATSTAAMDMFHNATTGARNMLEVVDFSDSLTLAAVSTVSYVASKCVPDTEMPEGKVGNALKAIPSYLGKGIAWPFRKIAKGIRYGAAAAGRGIACSAKKITETAADLGSRVFEKLKDVSPTQQMPASMAPTPRQAPDNQQGSSGEEEPLPATEEMPQPGAGGFITNPENMEYAYEDGPSIRGLMEIPLDNED